MRYNIIQAEFPFKCFNKCSADPMNICMETVRDTDYHSKSTLIQSELIKTEQYNSHEQRIYWRALFYTPLVLSGPINCECTCRCDAGNNCWGDGVALTACQRTLRC